MLCRKKLSPRRKKLRKILAAVLVLTLLFVWYVEYAVKEQLQDVIIRNMRTISETAVTMAAQEYLAENPDSGEKLCRIICSHGAVAALSADTANVNAVKTQITKKAQRYIDELSRSQGVGTQLGNFTGLVFLTNVGPEVRFSVESTQTVSCAFKSVLESAGINQSIHHITMTVTVELLVYNPFRISDTIRTESTFEIAQTVIVGAVPNYSGVVSTY